MLACLASLEAALNEYSGTRNVKYCLHVKHYNADEWAILSDERTIEIVGDDEDIEDMYDPNAV